MPSFKRKTYKKNEINRKIKKSTVVSNYVTNKMRCKSLGTMLDQIKTAKNASKLHHLPVKMCKKRQKSTLNFLFQNM